MIFQEQVHFKLLYASMTEVRISCFIPRCSMGSERFWRILFSMPCVSEYLPGSAGRGQPVKCDSCIAVSSSDVSQTN